MKILILWLINTVSIVITAYLLRGVEVTDFATALVAALVLGIINATLKPILFLLTLPITVLTLGLFTLIINAGLILLTSNLVPGFTVDGFWWALLFSIVLTIINYFLHKIIE